MKRTVVFDMADTIYTTVKSTQEQEKLGSSYKEMPQALDVFLDLFEQGYKIVIISNSIIQHSRQVLQKLLEMRGEDAEYIKQIFAKIDILTMQYFGTKHDSEAWKEAMNPYKNIDYIFEDGEHKLEAAGQAAQELGNEPDLYQKVSDFYE